MKGMASESTGQDISSVIACTDHHSEAEGGIFQNN